MVQLDCLRWRGALGGVSSGGLHPSPWLVDAGAEVADRGVSFGNGQAVS